MFLRKAQAGSDSYGNEWPHDDAVIEVPDHQAADLLAIQDAGFTVVEQPADEPESESTSVTEPAPAADNPVTEPAPEVKPRGRRSTKATAPVEE